MIAGAGRICARIAAVALAAGACGGGEPAADDGDTGGVPDAATTGNPIYQLYLSDEAWTALHEDVDADVRVRGTLMVGGDVHAVEVELQGYASRKYDKKSFKIFFDDDALLAESPFTEGGPGPIPDKVILKAMWKDRSMIREVLAWRVLRTIGHEVPRTGFVNLAINGEDWGLYVAVEPIDDDFLERCGYDDDGNLYKAVAQAADFDPKRDLDDGFEKKTHEDESWEDLEELVERLQTTPPNAESFAEEIDPIFSLDRYFERMIWASFVQNGDAVRQNFYLYNEPGHGRDHWIIFSWDSDVCLSAHWKLSEPFTPWDELPNLDGGNYFSRRLVKIDSLRHEYVDRFLELLDTELRPERMLAQLDELKAQVEVDLARDLERWDRDVTVDEEMGHIRDLLENRPEYLRSLLPAFRDDPDED